MTKWIVALLALVPQDPPRQDRPGPWDGDLWLLESTDGVRFKKKNKLLEGGGVPTLIADRKGRLIAAYQWFPKDRSDAFDRIAVSVSEDQGKSWTEPKPIAIEGFPEEMIRPCDPTLVELEDGRFRIYFTTDRKKSGKKGWAAASIHSAVSGDAMAYRYEPEARFAVEGEMVIDCAVARLGNEWHLYSPVQEKAGRGYHAVSQDGLQFDRRKDVTLDTRGTWLGCAITTDKGLRFYGSGLAATSADGEAWRLDRDAGYEGADPGAARTTDGRWLMLATVFGKRRQPKHEEGTGGVTTDDKFVYILKDGRLVKVDPETMKVVDQATTHPTESGRDSDARKAYWDHMKGLDSSKAPKHQAKVFAEPKTVRFGKKIRLDGGLFPRMVRLGDAFYAFTARKDGFHVRGYDGDWNPTDFKKNLTPKGSRDIDHDLTASGDFVYHFAMLPSGAGQVRKFDKSFNLVAQTPVFRVGPTDMVLDQNIAVVDGKVYAAGEYREGGPWRPMSGGVQNIPPDAKVARGVHLRIFDLDLKPLGEKDLTANIPGAAVANQFWGLGTSQLRAGGYHCLVVHTPVGNVAKFGKGESIGARQIFLLRYDDQFKFVDAKGPLSDTDCDNSWCTGSAYEDGRYYVAYASVSKGYIPGPGEEASDPAVQNIRLGIFDEKFEEIETVDVTKPGDGGHLPDVLKVGDRVYVSYSGGPGGTAIQELIVR